MDLGALTEYLIALKETVNSIVINEDKNVGDFELSVERFQVLLEDLIVVSKALDTTIRSSSKTWNLSTLNSKSPTFLSSFMTIEFTVSFKAIKYSVRAPRSIVNLSFTVLNAFKQFICYSI